MPYEVPEFKLEDYPVNTAGGRLEVLDAETIYCWDKKFWLAVLKVKSKFGQNEKVSVRIYRWKWSQSRDSGVWRWTVDQKHNINKKELWEKTKAAVDRMIGDLR